ncbi:MAG: 3'(2'),5'-bisphosphate nucleotidase CysQ [Bacteroidia bacterium]|nr:3'(2'),5'-bisphosphate nucleotidase CysQ [Bacteroidia bacterium]
MDLSKLTADLNQTAIEAGRKILEIYNDESLFQQVDHKADDSPLTLADKAAHDVIMEQLTRLTPDIPVLSEEGGNHDYESRRDWKKFWLVDPLDGTKEFIKRNGEFTVNIALVEDGKVIMGVVHVPVQGITYYAAKGQGAFVQYSGEEPNSISVSKFSMKDKGLRVVCSRSHMSDSVKKYIEQFDSPETVAMGSSLKIVLIAEGKADIYPRLGPTMEWDTAAAQIVVEEAGGVLVKHESGEALSYNKADLLNPHFLVFGKFE